MNMPYSTEEDVYEACGMNVQIVKDLSGKTVNSEITAIIDRFIKAADQKVRRALGVPITIRKEPHTFEKNPTVELGPYEDDLEFFGSYDPEDCVEKIFAIYSGSGRIKLPYPRHCDILTEDTDNFDGSQAGVTVSQETTIIKCGDASIKAIFTTLDYFTMYKGASSEVFNKLIYPWNFIGFWFRTTDSTRTFTIRLYDKDGNYESQDFTVDFNNTWTLVPLAMKNFSGATDINWTATLLSHITIYASDACTIYIDNFNFNNGYFWTTPEGLICFSDPASTAWGTIKVTYSFDPYRDETPSDLREASAKFAGVLLLDYLIGCRQRETAFQQMHDTADVRPDRETMEVVRARLQREAQSCLMGIGYKTYEGMGSA